MNTHGYTTPDVDQYDPTFFDLSYKYYCLLLSITAFFGTRARMIIEHETFIEILRLMRLGV